MAMFGEWVLRGGVSFLFLLVLCRLIGRKLISQFTFFDFATAITLGALAGTLAAPDGNPFLGIMTVMAVFAAMTILFGFIDLKSRSFRKIVNAEPVVLIVNGALNKANMEKLRLPEEQLMILLRQKQVFSVTDVELAILETSGELSVLLVPEKRPLTPADLALSAEDLAALAQARRIQAEHLDQAPGKLH